MRNEIDVFFNRVQNIVAVFFSQRRQVDAYTRHIHTLAASQSSIIAYFTEQSIFILINNLQCQFTVVHQHICSD